MHRSVRRLIVSSALLTAAAASAAHAAVVITGGTYRGADGSTSFPGYSAYGVNDGRNDNIITGGTFVGGRGGVESTDPNNYYGPGSGGVGLLVYVSGTGLLIGGGSFTGGVGGNAKDGGFNRGGDGGYAVQAYADGSVTVRGGTFAGGAGGTGGSGNGDAGVEFYAYNGGSITLVGDFTVFPASPVTNGTGTITGRLADNTAVATYTYDIRGGMLTVVTPEPASLTALAAAGLLLPRRRRSTAR